MKSRIIALLLFVVPSLALAAEHEIVQKDKKFSQNEISVKVGDTIKFVNSDPTTHHVFSTKAGMKFNAKQPKGAEPFSFRFEKAGETTVRCAIHPKMKLKVTVTK